MTPHTCTYELGGAHYIQPLLLLTVVGGFGIVVVVCVVFVFVVVVVV